jgi:hypothetical protein
VQSQFRRLEKRLSTLLTYSVNALESMCCTVECFGGGTYLVLYLSEEGGRGEGVGLRIYKFYINDLPRGTLDGDQRAVCGFERRCRFLLIH